MYVFRRQVRAHQGIATLLAIALVLWVTGTHMFMKAEAANLTYIKDTLSNSAPSETSNHTIQFLSPTGVLAGGTIVVTFPNGFNIGTSSVNFADIDLAVGGSDQTLAAAAAPGVWGVSTSSQNLIFTSNDSTVGSNATVTIEIGTNATFGATGDAQITNPSATSSYEFTATAGASDSGQFRVAIVDDVVVTANVDTTFTFTITGVGNGATVNSSPTSTAATTTSDTLPFGTLAANVSKTLAQDLAVVTNAANGFVVTVEQSGQLQSSTGADIDGFVNGNWTTTPTAWTAPSNTVGSENTWGHWGLTSEDGTTTRSAQFTSNTWVAASTTPVVIMSHTGPANGVTQGEGAARIGYQAQIGSLQEAGDDYTTTLTYIATPTF